MCGCFAPLVRCSPAYGLSFVDCTLKGEARLVIDPCAHSLVWIPRACARRGARLIRLVSGTGHFGMQSCRPARGASPTHPCPRQSSLSRKPRTSRSPIALRYPRAEECAHSASQTNTPRRPSKPDFGPLYGPGPLAPLGEGGSCAKGSLGARLRRPRCLCPGPQGGGRPASQAGAPPLAQEGEGRNTRWARPPLGLSRGVARRSRTMTSRRRRMRGPDVPEDEGA